MKYFTLLLLNFVFICSNVCQVWTPVSPYPSGYSYFDIHMEESGEGIAVGDEGIISKTMDFGDSFTNIFVETASKLNSIHKSKNGTYIIVGNEGTILRSTNKGIEWQKLDSGSLSFLNKVYFLDDKVGIILGDNGVVLRTEDDGETWVDISINGGEDFNKLTFVNSTVGFIWEEDARTLYKTVDAGLNWIELETGIRINAISFQNDDYGVIFSQTGINSGKSFVSNDGGYTWQESEAVISSFREVQFIDNLIGIAQNALGRIYTTVDGGENWNRTSIDYIVPAKIVAISSNLCYFIKGEIFRSYDFGETLESLKKTIPETYLEEFTFGSTNEVYVVGSRGIHKSVNGGMNFNRLPIDSIQFMEDVICFGANNVIAIGQNSTFIQSVDGGETWSKKELPESGHYVAMSRIGNTIWVVVENGYLMRSEDLGETWHTVHTFQSTMFSKPYYITFINNSVGFMRNEGGVVMRTENGGVDWEIIDVEWIGPKCISFVDEELGYMSGLGVYKTENGGKSWELINEELHEAYSLFFRNEFIGYYAGADGKIYKTVDGGISWKQEISFTNQYLFSIKFNPSGIGIAVGYGGTLIRIEEDPLSESLFNHSMATTNMMVFPNPTTQEINLISENIIDKSVLLLYNINGHLISKMKGNQSGSPIDVRSLPSGTYYLLHFNGEVREKGVFVKQ